jgi:hypothetical protein
VPAVLYAWRRGGCSLSGGCHKRRCTFSPRCALNFEEHVVRYAGLDRSAVGGRKYFTALALSNGVKRDIRHYIALGSE